MHEKNIFYKNQKQEYNQNINAKKAFITRSKEILDSPEWDSKVQEMKNLQKDWKSIGFVPRKLDNKLWSEFSEIHKVFFDRIKSGYQRLSEEQEAILNEKRTFLEQLKTTQFSDDPETLQTELNAQWENWNAIVKIGGQTEIDLNKEFSSSLTKIVSNIKLDDKTQKEVLLGLNSLLLQNNPEKLQKQLNDIKTTLSRLKTERTQLENNLEFFSQSSSENPLFKNVEKQIKSCQTKIDKTQEEYIRLKQIKNAQLKLAKQQSEQAEKDSNQESEEV
jgi:DNA repair exonuclease SbcCD ATPase subunit